MTKTITNVFDLLAERGFIHTTTHNERLRAALATPTTFYLGIDPTADNLHIGHFLALRVFKILQDHGHKGIILLGTGTALVGDPSGKSEMRKMLSPEEVAHNTAGIKATLARFIDVDKAIYAENGDWLKPKDCVSYAVEILSQFNIAEMLSHDCYKNRVSNGLTLFEMTYMTMQAYDFVHLNTEYGCTLQIGGSDQWANITAGSDLGRKMAFGSGKPRPEMFGLCIPLLVNANGTKMGKTEKGTLWVSRPNEVNTELAFDCYQHFYNVHDADVERLLTFFTDLPVAEIKRMCEADIIAAKKYMATAVTTRIHGDFALDTPTVEISTPADATIVDILVASALASSKREAREFVISGAISVNNEKVTDIAFVPTSTEFTLKKGKKTYLKITINP